MIVLQRSDDLDINQRSWRSFKDIYDTPVARLCKASRPLKSAPSSPSAPHTPQSSLTDAETPSTTDGSELLKTPPSSRRRKKRKRSKAKPEEVIYQPEVIDLTGDSLDYAKKFKRALNKKGRVQLTIVGEDNIPFTCTIPPSDSESEGYDESRGPWSHLDADKYEI